MESSPPKEDPFLDLQIGSCRIESLLGRGGMGSVYKAHHMGLDKPVALKILSTVLANDDSFVKRFIQEARAAAKLEHANIVQVLDVGMDQGYYYIIMHYVDGEGLDEAIRREGTLKEATVARIAREIASGLSVAHSHGIIHRDIKPSNIMITPDGTVRIADFGLARRLDATTALTTEGSFLGTAEYASPEQCDGREADHRSDLYSLGCVMFTMLMGRSPFGGGKVWNVAMKHIQEPSPPMYGAPEHAARITERLLQKNPEDRYPDAKSLVSDLTMLLEGSSTVPSARPPRPRAKVPPPPPPPSRPTKPTQKTQKASRTAITRIVTSRITRNVMFWVLTLISAELFVFLGSLGDSEPASFLEALFRPFRPANPGFIMNLAVGLMGGLLLLGAFLVNRKELRTSWYPLAVIGCAILAMPFFYAGALSLNWPITGGDYGPDKLAPGLFRRTAMMPLGLGGFAAGLFLMSTSHSRMRIPLIGGGMVLAGLAMMLAYGFRWWPREYEAMSHLDANTDLGMACGGVGVIALAIALYMLMPRRTGGVKMIGIGLATLAMIALFVGGVLWQFPESITRDRALREPLRFLIEGWDGHRLPGVVGVAFLMLAAVVLYRKAGFYHPDRR